MTILHAIFVYCIATYVYCQVNNGGTI